MKKVIIALVLGMFVGSTATALAETSESVQAVFAKFNIIVNGEKKDLKTTPLVVEGTSYLPVREVSGLLGYELGYDDATRTINLNSKESIDTETEGTKSTNVNLEQWISLRDLATKKKVKVSAATTLIYLEKDSRKLTITLPNDFSEKHVPFSADTSEGRKIGVYISEGTTYFNLADLTSLNYIE